MALRDQRGTQISSTMTYHETMDNQIKADENILNPAAWVDEYGDYLYRYAISRLRNSEASEEVVQETFLAALKHVQQYQAKGTERAWLLGILKRKIIDFIRDRSRTKSLSEEDLKDLPDTFFDQKGNWQKEARSTSFAPLCSLERKDFWRILQGCLDKLPTRQADVFVLREMDDQSTEVICDELEISASNLWVLLHRARLQLAQCMKNCWQQN